MTPSAFAAKVRRIAKALPQEVRAAERETIAETRQELIKRSSGNLTSGQLARAGHPYATRAPNSAYDPSVINAQTGHFRASWVKSGPAPQGGGLVSQVVNSDPVAAYMMGTRRMVARRVDSYVVAKMKPIRRRRLREAWRRALKA